MWERWRRPLTETPRPLWHRRQLLDRSPRRNRNRKNTCLRHQCFDGLIRRENWALWATAKRNRVRDGAPWGAAGGCARMQWASTLASSMGWIKKWSFENWRLVHNLARLDKIYVTKWGFTLRKTKPPFMVLKTKRAEFCSYIQNC